MANLAQQMQNKGFNPAPAPATTPTQPEEDKYNLPGPIEIYPGVTFDPQVAKDEPEENYLFGLFKGPSAKAYTPTTPAMRAQSEQAFEAARMERLTPKAQEYGVNVNPYGTQISDLIRQKAPEGMFEGQSQLYLADTDEQYMNAMENIFGEGNVRMIKDEGPKVSMFDATNYISVKDDTGEWTDFAPASTSFKDYAERVAPGLIAEVGASTAIVPAAFATSTAVSAVTGPFALVLGPATFVYTLYAGGKGIEAGRQYLQDELGLNDQEAIDFSGYLDAAYKIGVPQIEGMTTDKRTPAETQREVSGILEMAFATIPGLADKMKLAIGRVRSSGKIGPTTYESAVSATKTVEATMPGGAMDIGVPLENLMLQQITPNKIVERLGKLTEQTSLVIPLKIREQMQSAVAYLKQFGQNVGQGDFTKFRNEVASIGQTLQSVKNAPNPDEVVKDLTTIGENLGTLDDLFLRLRGIEARGLYNNVFDKVKTSSYDLDKIRALLPEGTRTIIPTTPAGATRTSKDKVAGAVPPPKRGERLVDDLITDLMNLGRVQKDGTRVMTPAQVKAAVKDFTEKNPGFEFDPKNLDSPAKILHLYASRFGQLARDNFSTAGTTPDSAQFRQAMEIRNALLDLIGNPTKPVAGVADDLATANSFYKETFDLSSTEAQIAARNSRRGAIKGEPAVLPETLATTPTAGGRVAPGTITMENINAQEKYVRDFLNNPANVEKITADTAEKFEVAGGAAQQLKDYFANTISSKLARATPTDPADVVGANEVIKFLDSFEPRQLRALGIDEATEAQIRNDATLIANLQRGGAVEQVLGAPARSTMAEQFETILRGDTAQVRTGFNELLSVVRRAATPEAKDAAKENLRQGLLNHIISPQSGVLKQLSSNSAYGEVGQYTIDVPSLQKVIEQLNKVNAFDDILTAQDKQVLDGIAEYAGVVAKRGEDAGSALAGAQIIGEMFTLDPSKFIAGLARLGSQARIARLFANEEFVKAATGIGKPMSTAEKLRTMFFGKGTMGTIAARIAMEEMGFRESDDEQTNRMLQQSAASSALGRRLQRYQNAPTTP